MARQVRSPRVPWYVHFFNPIARFLPAAGVPMGPSAHRRFIGPGGIPEVFC